MERQPSQSNQGLEHEHDLQSIQDRVKTNGRPNDLPDAILGAVDGSITTFAVVAGAVGGGFSGVVVVVLGFAKVLADAFSMAVSNYLGEKSKAEATEEAWRMERRHIETVPEGERLELREIFRKKGFDGPLLDEVVAVISRDREQWIRTMLSDELGVSPEMPRPVRAGATTFLAFMAAGVLPLVPFLIPEIAVSRAFFASLCVTAIVFLSIGVLKGWSLKRPIGRAAVETLLTGGIAAALAYFVGNWLSRIYGS